MNLAMTEVWRLLPHVVEEHIQSLQPFPDSVEEGYPLNCKLPESGATLWLLNLNRDASFMVMRYGPKPGYNQSSPETSLGWCFIDLKARRWYIAKDEDQKPRHNFGGVGVAIDGDLACHYLYNPVFVNNPTASCVYNPIAKTRHVLPPTPNHQSPQSCVELHTVIDSLVPQFFKLVLVHPTLHHKISETSEPSMYLDDPFMHVYDSTTHRWMCTRNSRLYLENIHSFHQSKSVIFQGLMYILLSFPDQRQHMLKRVELNLQSAWENVAVHIPGELFMPKLIVSANRLFLVGWWEDLFSESKFQVSEINVPTLTLNSVLEWTVSDVKQRFGINTVTVGETVTEKYFIVTGEVFKRIVCPSISAFGFGDSLMFMSESSGNCVVYDVEAISAFSCVKNLWDKPLITLFGLGRHGYTSFSLIRSGGEVSCCERGKVKLNLWEKIDGFQTASG